MVDQYLEWSRLENYKGSQSQDALLLFQPSLSDKKLVKDDRDYGIVDGDSHGDYDANGDAFDDVDDDEWWWWPALSSASKWFSPQAMPCQTYTLLSKGLKTKEAQNSFNKQKSLAMIGLQFVRVLNIENKNSHDTPKVVQQTQLSCWN